MKALRALRALALACVLLSTPSRADQSPPGCNGNGVGLGLASTLGAVRRGGMMDYQVTIQNLNDPSIGAVACDVGDVDVVFYCPGGNGEPAFGAPQVLTTSLALPAGTPPMPLGGTLTCSIDVDAGVAEAVAEVRAGDQAGPLDDLTEGRLYDRSGGSVFRSFKKLGAAVVANVVDPVLFNASTNDPAVDEPPGLATAFQVSSAQNGTDDPEDAFGNQDGDIEPDTFIFGDGGTPDNGNQVLGDGDETVDHIQWQTTRPVTILGYRLKLTQADPFGRRTELVRFLADGVERDFFDNDSASAPDNFTVNVIDRLFAGPVTGSTFRMELTRASNGPRIHEIDALVESVCGNGIVEGAEECDDGARLPGDGCSPLCGAEACPMPASIPVAQILDAGGDGLGAVLESPRSLALAPDGTVVVAGGGSNNVFGIDRAGTVAVLLDASGDGQGNPLANPTAVAADRLGGLFVAADAGMFRLTAEGVATLAVDQAGDGAGNALLSPVAAATDALDNAYVGGNGSDNVFRLTPAGVVTRVAGPDDGIDFLGGLAVHGLGTLFASAAGEHAVVRVDAGDAATVIDAAGDGVGHALQTPVGVATDARGNLLVAGFASDNVFRVTPGGAVTQILDAGGDGMGAALDGPVAVATDDGGEVVYVAGAVSNTVLRAGPGGEVARVLGPSGDGASPLANPRSVAADGAGNVWVAGGDSNNVFKVALCDDGPQDSLGTCPYDFVEAFDDGDVAPHQTMTATTGFAATAECGRLVLRKEEGTGNGSASVRTTCAFDGDIVARARAWRADLGAAARMGLRVATTAGSGFVEIYFVGMDEVNFESEAADRLVFEIRRTAGVYEIGYDAGAGFVGRTLDFSLPGPVEVALFITQESGETTAHHGAFEWLTVRADAVDCGTTTTTTPVSSTTTTTVPPGCAPGDLECAAATVQDLVSALECTGKCRCDKLAGRAEKIALKLAQAADTTKAKRCKRKLKAARKAAKKLEKQVRREIAKGCLGPPEVVAALEEAVAALRAAIKTATCPFAGADSRRAACAREECSSPFVQTSPSFWA